MENDGERLDQSPRRLQKWELGMKLRYAVVTAIAGLLCASGPALAQDAIKTSAQKTVGAHSAAMVPSLAVLNSGGAKLENGKLTMNRIAPTSIVFADRPVRAAGQVLTADFIKQWDEGNDSFAKDSPNATISVMSSEGDNLTFDVSVLEGDLAGANGPASLFVDWFAARGGFGHVGVVGGVGFHAPVWHGGWYAHPGAWLAAGAMIGAAAASAYRPYYPPSACGYYPYPPCY